MMISIIIIVPPCAIGRGKMLTAVSTVFIMLARRRQLARACLSLFSKGLEGRSQSELDFVMTT